MCFVFMSVPTDQTLMHSYNNTTNNNEKIILKIMMKYFIIMQEIMKLYPSSG